MKQPIKCKITKYIVEVNGVPVREFSGIGAAKQAKDFIRKYPIKKDIKNIDLIRESMLQFIVKSFRPKTTTVLTVDDLDSDFIGAITHE
jgi:hypothetical protein